MEDYSKRFLSHEADKLPALSGLVQEYSNSNHGYAAGLWGIGLPSALLWRSVPSPPSSPLEAFMPRRPVRYRAPTRSWASIDGHITYESQKVHLQGCDQTLRLAEHGFGNFQVREICVSSCGEDPRGAISGGWMRLTGCLKAAGLNVSSPRENGKICEEWKMLLDSEGETIGVLYADTLTELQHGQTIYCLSVCNERYWSMVSTPSLLYHRPPEPEGDEGPRATVMGLALVQHRQCPNEYRRVGLVRWIKISYFSDTAPSEINVY